MMTSVTNSRASSSAPRPRTAKQAVATALRAATYEILPLKSAEEKVLAHVPKDVELTVTTTEAKGLAPTIDLAVKLGEAGYRAAPHLAARQVRDRAHLIDLVTRLREASVDSVFVIGGDAAESGEYPDALTLLEAMKEIGHPFSTVGIGGYPEGHGKIADDLIEQAMKDKAPYVTQIISQLCFDGDTTIEWAREVAGNGVDLPIRVGIPGAISRQKLIRVSAGLGLGQSAKFLSKQQNMFWRFFRPGGYNPNKLIERLTPAFAQQDNNLQGFHVYTFNDLDSTEAWRQRWLAKLS